MSSPLQRTIYPNNNQYLNSGIFGIGWEYNKQILLKRQDSIFKWDVITRVLRQKEGGS
jgi:hypothetical protein